MNTKAGLEWILKNHEDGKVSTTPVEVHCTEVTKYLNKGYRVVQKCGEFIRLDKENSFVIYNTKDKFVIIDYQSKD